MRQNNVDPYFLPFLERIMEQTKHFVGKETHFFMCQRLNQSQKKCLAYILLHNIMLFSFTGNHGIVFQLEIVTDSWKSHVDV